MHRPTFESALPRTRIAVALAILAVLVLAAVVAEPGSRTSPTSEVRNPVDRMATPGEMVDPVVDAATAGSVQDPAERADGAPVDGTAPHGEAAIGGTGDAGDAASTVAPAGAGLPTAQLDTRVVRTGSIELKTPRRRFEQAWGDVQAVATGSGGYVIGASRSGAGDSARRATITMRVPSAKFETAIERLRELRGAKVGRLDVSSEDVTPEFVDTRSRLRHDRAVEGRLLALLADADGVGEVLAVQARLDGLQQRIEVARGRLEYLERMTSMGTIEVSIVTPAAPGSDRHERSDLGQAFADAGSRFIDNVARAVVWLGGALPALILLAATAIVARLALRRRASGPDRTPAQPR